MVRQSECQLERRKSSSHFGFVSPSNLSAKSEQIEMILCSFKMLNCDISY